MSQLFASGGQSIGASASVFLVNIPFFFFSIGIESIERKTGRVYVPNVNLDYLNYGGAMGGYNGHCVILFFALFTLLTMSKC